MSLEADNRDGVSNTWMDANFDSERGDGDICGDTEQEEGDEDGEYVLSSNKCCILRMSPPLG